MAPWYVKLVVWGLIWFGLPTLGCVAFFLMFIGVIPSPLVDLRNDMRMHREEMLLVKAFMAANTRLAQQICRNTSRDPAERAQCYQ